MKKEKKFSEELLKRVMYFHGKTTDGYRFTIAGLIEGKYLNMGISVCGDRDNFVKSTGRSIATTRLLSTRNSFDVGKYYIEIQDPIENEFKFFTYKAARHNAEPKKMLLKGTHLYRHDIKLPLPF